MHTASTHTEKKVRKVSFTETLREIYEIEKVRHLLKKGKKKALSNMQKKRLSQTQTPELVTFVKDIGGSLSLRFSKNEWFLELTHNKRVFTSQGETLARAIIELTAKFARYEPLQ